VLICENPWAKIFLPHLPSSPLHFFSGFSGYWLLNTGPSPTPHRLALDYKCIIEIELELQGMSGEVKRSEIQQHPGRKHEDCFRLASLLPALNAGLIEMMIPDKPTSSMQKYRRTNKGLLLQKVKTLDDRAF